MRRNGFSRRDVLKGTAALAAGMVYASPLRAAAPPPSAVTPELIEFHAAASAEARQEIAGRYGLTFLPGGG